MRLVGDLNALKEKAFIFEAGLDDRVIELYTMLTLTKLHADNPEEVPDHLLFTKQYEDETGKQIALAAFRDRKYMGVLELPYSLYQTCVVTGEPIRDVPTPVCTAIDQDWIAERLKDSGEEQESEECGCDGEDCDAKQ